MGTHSHSPRSKRQRSVVLVSRQGHATGTADNVVPCTKIALGQADVGNETCTTTAVLVDEDVGYGLVASCIAAPGSTQMPKCVIIYREGRRTARKQLSVEEQLTSHSLSAVASMDPLVAPQTPLGSMQKYLKP
jgi:hypothetical protein